MRGNLREDFVGFVLVSPINFRLFNVEVVVFDKPGVEPEGAQNLLLEGRVSREKRRKGEGEKGERKEKLTEVIFFSSNWTLTSRMTG